MKHLFRISLILWFLILIIVMPTSAQETEEEEDSIKTITEITEKDTLRNPRNPLTNYGRGTVPRYSTQLASVDFLKEALRKCRQGGWPAGRYDLRRRNP